MLKPARIRACLGNPPCPFYTNDVESHNNVIKLHTNYTAQELPQELVSNQKKEIEQAVVGMGEYRVAIPAKKLSVDTRKFFQMSESQREQTLQHFFSAPYSSLRSADTSLSSTCCFSDLQPEANPLLECEIPGYLANKIWKEACDLSLSESNVCPSPGSAVNAEWLVKSSVPSHPRPFYVQKKDSGQITCELSCVMYHSSGLCVHTVTIAKKLRCTQELIKWLRGRNSLNLTKVAKSGLPKAGKKPHSKRKFSVKSSTQRVQQLLDGVSEDSFSPRSGIVTNVSHLRAEEQEYVDEQEFPEPEYTNFPELDIDFLEREQEPSTAPALSNSPPPLI